MVAVKMKNLIKKWLGVAELEQSLAKANDEIDRLKSKENALSSRLSKMKVELNHYQNVVNKALRKDVDLSVHDDSYVILSGKLHGKDYVSVERVDRGYFEKVAEEVREMRKHGASGRVDAPISMRGMF